jgi:AcrR family transcriptional regulator
MSNEPPPAKTQPDNGKATEQNKPCQPASQRAFARSDPGCGPEAAGGRGLQALTIEVSWRQAGVGKQTIYRWWKCRAELVLEAYANHTSSKIPVPDRGSLRADLEAFLTAGCKRLTDISGPIMRGLIADAVLDDEFREVLLAAFLHKRQEAFQALLQRGVERGELSAEADLDIVCDVVFGAVWHRLLLESRADSTHATRRLAALVIAAYRPPPA